MFLYVFFWPIQWQNDKQLVTHENIQDMSTDITIHMLHILQYTKGHISGSNTNCSKKHVLPNLRLNFTFLILCTSKYK